MGGDVIIRVDIPIGDVIGGEKRNDCVDIPSRTWGSVENFLHIAKAGKSSQKVESEVITGFEPNPLKTSQSRENQHFVFLTVSPKPSYQSQVTKANLEHGLK